MSNFIDINEAQKKEYNSLVEHPLQSFEWGEFRKKTGTTVVRKARLSNNKLSDAFTLTIHRIPHTPYTIGYFPKGGIPTQEILKELRRIGKKYKCIFIQLEPNTIKKDSDRLLSVFSKDAYRIIPSAHPLFTKYTFVLDLTKSEEELLKAMHSKTRYNIKVAQKHRVIVSIEDSQQTFNEYLRLTKETTTRQKFYAHTPTYHKIMWQTLHSDSVSKNSLSAHLLVARYKPPEHPKEEILTTWILFVFKDTLYYPYGASSSTYRNVMASNLVMWEAIKFGRRNGLKRFDMWGALSDNPDSSDPWYGFHKFKSGYGPEHIEYTGSFDFIIHPALYKLYVAADKMRWAFLKLRK